MDWPKERREARLQVEPCRAGVKDIPVGSPSFLSCLPWRYCKPIRRVQCNKSTPLMGTELWLISVISVRANNL
jgi:hypothetical protein